MARPTKAEADPHPSLAVVVWDDAWSAGIEVLTIKEIEEKHKPAVMQSLGWVIKSDSAGISLANERCMDKGDECYRGHTFIPRSLIKSVTPFTLTPKRKPHAKTAVHPPAPAPAEPVPSLRGESLAE